MKRSFVFILSLFILSGCGRNLKQEFSVVEIVPISDEHRLVGGLKSSICVFPAKTSTGQEQYSKIASHSLARVLKKNNEENKVLSFADFSNEVNKRNLCLEVDKLTSFYKGNNVFKGDDLQVLGKEIGIDYFILPTVIYVLRTKEGRFSAAGFKVVSTQKICLVSGIEIWDKRGYFVFGASSDTTISDERLNENPISIEQAFEFTWQSIIDEINDSKG